MEYQAIVLCAGSGTRCDLKYNKVLYKIDKQTIIEKSVALFLNDPECNKIIIAYNKIDQLKIISMFDDNRIMLVEGGKTRAKSVSNALKYITSPYVLIHDGARPFATKELVNRIKDALLTHESVIPVIEIFDAIKMVKDNVVVKTMNKDYFKAVQTPQGFKTEIIKKAHFLATSNQYNDDAMMIEKILRKKVFCVEGEYSNYKITIKEDL